MRQNVVPADSALLEQTKKEKIKMKNTEIVL